MRKIYRLENLDCANCAAKLENAIAEIEGVDRASVNFLTQKLVIETEEDIDKILQKIKKVINKVEPDCEIFE